MKEKYIERMTFNIINHGDCKYLGQYCYADSIENFLIKFYGVSERQE